MATMEDILGQWFSNKDAAGAAGELVKRQIRVSGGPTWPRAAATAQHLTRQPRSDDAPPLATRVTDTDEEGMRVKEAS